MPNAADWSWMVIALHECLYPQRIAEKTLLPLSAISSQSAYQHFSLHTTPIPRIDPTGLALDSTLAYSIVNHWCSFCFRHSNPTDPLPTLVSPWATPPRPQLRLQPPRLRPHTTTCSRNNMSATTMQASPWVPRAKCSSRAAYAQTPSASATSACCVRATRKSAKSLLQGIRRA